MSEWAVCMRILIDLRSSKVFRSAALYKLTLVQRFVPQYFFSEESQQRPVVSLQMLISVSDVLPGGAL
jgi:hypothetical protein